MGLATLGILSRGERILQIVNCRTLFEVQLSIWEVRGAINNLGRDEHTFCQVLPLKTQE